MVRWASCYHRRSRGIIAVIIGMYLVSLNTSLLMVWHICQSCNEIFLMKRERFILQGESRDKKCGTRSYLDEIVSLYTLIIANRITYNIRIQST